jgi:hypothetical protein
MTASIIKRAASARLTTVEGVCLDLGRPLGTPADRQIDRFIDQVSGTVAAFCRRTFGRQIYCERIDEIPADGLDLQHAPLNRIVSLGVRGGARFVEDAYLISDGKLLLTGGSSAGGDISAFTVWHARLPALIVTYEAGWLLPGEVVGDDFTGDTPLPAEIERAAVQLVGVSLSEAGRDATIKQDSVEGIGSRSYYVQGASASLPHPAAEATLLRHQMPVLV